MAPRAFAILVAICLGTPHLASACSCVEWPAERQMSEASQVFLGRYARPGPDGDGDKLHFTVVESLKGELRNVFELPRPPDDDCERTFQDRELALVLVVKGHIPVCAGNVDIDKVLPMLGDYFTLGGHANSTPSLEVMKVALAGQLGAARKLDVYAPALAGKKLTVGHTQVSFVAGNGAELFAASGITSGSVTYVTLRPPSHLVNYLLIAPDRGRLSVLYSWKRPLPH